MTSLRASSPGNAPRGVLHGALAAARAFVIDPPEADRCPVAVPSSRPVVAVFGLANGCGATMVSRAIAAELAARDATGASVVTCESKPAGLPFATQAAARLARSLDDLPGGARALGRLCLLRGGDPSGLADALRGIAPLVIDAGSSSLGGVPACVADKNLIVTTPAIEPALARVAIECVARVGTEPMLVLNRAGPNDLREDDPALAEVDPALAEVDPVPAGAMPEQPGRLPETRHALPGAAQALPGPSQALPGPARLALERAHVLPESRLGAQLALGGREAPGGLGRAISALVASWEVGA